MIENAIVLITLPDYSGNNKSKFFTWDGVTPKPVSLKDLSRHDAPIVTSNFQFVASEMVRARVPLPRLVVDIEELVIAVSKNPNITDIREKFSLTEMLSRFGLDEQSRSAFQKLSCSSGEVDLSLIERVGQAHVLASKALERLARIRGEWNRFVEVEVPSMLLLYEHLLRGITFRKESLTAYRESIEFDYYKALKEFSAKHNLPLDVPSKDELADILADFGFDLHNTSVDFLLKFISLPKNLGEDVLSLRKLKTTKDALNGISHKKRKSYPQVLSQGARTSRILLRAPNLQNIAKKYRGMLVPADGKKLSYIDYDQYEVGIMGALSNDPFLLELYEKDDLYEHFAQALFGSKKKRKYAKRLFLSYAYGMRKQNLVNAAIDIGGSAAAAKKAFGQFKTFEKWKKELEKELMSARKMGTEMGNFFHLQHNKKPTAKEVRSAVSQKVQGTGSLIFKKALLALPSDRSYRVVLPMHDAVLVEHSASSDPEVVVKLFEDTLTNFFEGKIQGKASISSFASE
ncbi:DNA polymerase [Ruegeria atlantica]|uniref:DNA polymerase n=1 Tax=Ruegeria atlantica TaxID=81569 RepID=UPI002493E520|nr:DNA polymerase [Ruegeria atlantica]